MRLQTQVPGWRREQHQGTWVRLRLLVCFLYCLLVPPLGTSCRCWCPAIYPWLPSLNSGCILEVPHPLYADNSAFTHNPKAPSLNASHLHCDCSCLWSSFFRPCPTLPPSKLSHRSSNPHPTTAHQVYHTVFLKCASLPSLLQLPPSWSLSYSLRTKPAWLSQ